VVEKIAAAGGQARFVKLDVTSEADWETRSRHRDGVRQARSPGEQRGHQRHVRSGHAEYVGLDTLMNVNAKGVFLGMKHALPAMREAGGGAIVNISSISGFVGQDRIHMGYNASKGAVRIMTKSGPCSSRSTASASTPSIRASCSDAYLKASADPAWRENRFAQCR